MKTTLGLALASALLATPLARAGQEAEPQGPAATGAPVTLRAMLEPGRRSHYLLEKGREEWSGEALVRSTASTTPVDTEIVGRGERGSVRRWSYGRIQLAPSGQDERANALAEALAGLVSGLSFDLLLDESGSVAGFADEAAAQELLARHLASARAALLERQELVGAPGSPRRQQVESALDAAIAATSGPAAGAALLREPSFLYLLCGATLALGEPQESLDSLPSPLGAQPVPSRVLVELVELSADGTQARITYRQQLDQEKLRESLLEGMRRAAEQQGRPAPSSADLPTLDVRDDAELLFDLESGLPIRARWARTTTTVDRKRVDWWSIEPRSGEGAPSEPR